MIRLLTHRRVTYRKISITTHKVNRIMKAHPKVIVIAVLKLQTFDLLVKAWYLHFPVIKWMFIWCLLNEHAFHSHEIQQSKYVFVKQNENKIFIFSFENTLFCSFPPSFISLPPILVIWKNSSPVHTYRFGLLMETALLVEYSSFGTVVEILLLRISQIIRFSLFLISKQTIPVVIHRLE